MKRRTVLKSAAVATAIVAVGNVTARTLEVLNMPKAAYRVLKDTAYTYVMLGDGFEFIYPRSAALMPLQILYAAAGVYDFRLKKWVKPLRTHALVSEIGAEEKWARIRADDEARTNFDDVPIMYSHDLAELDYMLENDSDIVPYRFNMGRQTRRNQIHTKKLIEKWKGHA